MFWRIIRRLLGANRGRMMVMLLALGTGAALTAALLNIQVDAERRLTTEFTAFGPNVIVAPRDSSGASEASQPTLDQRIMERIPDEWDQRRVEIVPLLYLIAAVRKNGSDRQLPVVIAGKGGGNLVLGATGRGVEVRTLISCDVGAHVAAEVQFEPRERLILGTQAGQQSCNWISISQTGGPEDDQITVAVGAAQTLAALPNRISLVEITVPGTPQEISSYIANLQKRLADAEVRPIRQFTEGEAKIYNRIHGVLTATIAIVLILTVLCVMAAMTNVAMERKNDVGLMKAIGGATRRVLRLFLTEAALLGLTSGIIGAALGILLSIWLGKAVFGIAARPRLIVYPVAVALTTIVAILGAYPLRRLANIRPASVFRGEA